MNHLKIISKYLKRKNFIFRMPTIFIGDLPDDARQRDIEDFFRKYGRIEQIRLRNRFGFVDFRSQRDAEDAVRDLDGERMCGERVRLEISDGRRSGRRGSRDRGGSRDRYKQFFINLFHHEFQETSLQQIKIAITWSRWWRRWPIKAAPNKVHIGD